MNQLDSLIIAILSTSLLFSTADAATFQQVSNQPNSVLTNNTLSSEQIRQLAQSVTVKVFSPNKGGSGVLISKQGKTYTILTNAHVTSSKGSHSIQTFDGKTHTATVITRGDSLVGNDLAVLQFESQDNYQIISLASSSNLSENQEVFAAGFPDDSKELVITNGKISVLSSQPLIGGYQIGYTNEIRPGMSGGALLNQSGQLIGVNGLLNNAILNEAYTYQDGTQPNAQQIQQLRKLSFAVPIETLAKVAPNLTIIPLEWRNQQQVEKPSAVNTLADKVNNIAQKITVRINSKNNGNGSGVIIAKQGDTYYVVTAHHVVQIADNYEIITPDGKRYAVQPENIFKPEGLDAALVKFTSNQIYSVATIAKYNLYSSSKNRWIFISGFPGELGGKRKFTAGLLSRPEKVFARADNLEYLNNLIDVGYELIYTNITQPGMSGGAVLDSMGQVIGINTGSENKKSGEVELGLGLGVPSNSILGLAKKSGLKPELLKVVTTSPPKLTEAEINLLQNHPLFAAQKPPQNATEYDWLNYGNELWRLKKYSESVAAFQQAIKLKTDFYQAYLALGVTLYSQDKYPEALAAYEQTIKIKPDNDEAWLGKSEVLDDLKKYLEGLAAIDKAIEYNNSKVNLYVQRGLRLDDLKRYPEALAAMTKAIEMKPLSLYYSLRSSIRMESKDFEGALADVNQAIQLQPENAGNYSTRSIIRHLSNDFQGALADANQAIKIQPDNAEYYSMRMSIRLVSNDIQGALSDANQAIQIQPDDAENHYYRSTIRMQSKDYQGALADINQAIILEPDNVDYYLSRASFRFSLKDFQGSLADCNQAIKLEPKNGDGYHCRSTARSIAFQDPQGALSDSNQAIKLNPEHFSYYSQRGIVHHVLKDYQGALADFDQVIKLISSSNSSYIFNLSSVRNQGLALAYRQKGSARYELKDYQGALADYNEAIKLNPSSAQIYKGRSYVHYQLKDYQAALTDINQAIKFEPNNGEYHSNRAIFYIQLKDYQAALADYSQAIKFEPNNGEYYFNRGFVYIQLKNYPAALADYSQAIKLQPDNAQAYFYRGNIYVQLKDYQAALADFSQVIKFQPDVADAYFWRGAIYQKQGNDRAALAEYNQAIAKDAKLAPAIINIGYIKYENGDVDGAIAQWEKAVQINSTLAEPQMAIAVALYAKGEQQKALNMAQAALRLDKSFADVEVLKQNLWGTRLIDEARKLLSHPSIQGWQTKQ